VQAPVEVNKLYVVPEGSPHLMYPGPAESSVTNTLPFPSLPSLNCHPSPSYKISLVLPVTVVPFVDDISVSLFQNVR
jgi:hypothetical protein